MRRKPGRLKYAALILIVLLLCGYWFSLENDNFHAITPGEAYRSAQLKPDELASYIERYGIKSVLNLRGQSIRSSWYRDEMQVAAARNVAHFDVGLSARRAPTARETRELIEIFRRAPRPILIHCLGGADRSGLVAAMWKVVVDGEEKVEARRQLSFWYGHLPFGEKAVLDRFFTNWAPPAPSPAR